MHNFLTSLRPLAFKSDNGIENGKIKRLIPSSMVDTPVMDYQKWLNESKDKLASLENVSADEKVAIIGSGMSGLITGFELLRSGFTNFKIYEATNRIGGRFYSYKFPNDDNNFAELGAMRFPPSENCLYWYIKFLQDNSSKHSHDIILNSDFPDPGLVPTLVLYNGTQYEVNPGEPLPEVFKDINESWNGFLHTREPILLANGVQLDPPAQIMDWLDLSRPDVYNPVKAQNAWQGYVNYFKDKSFVEGVIAIFCQPNAPKTFNTETNEWGETYEWKYPQDIEKFGTIGTGIGGEYPLFNIGFICMLRFTLNKLEENHALLVTGTDSVVDALADYDFNGKKLRDFIELNSPVHHIQPDDTGETIGLLNNEQKLLDDKINHLVMATTHRSAEIEMGIDSLWQRKQRDVAEKIIPQRKRQSIGNLHIAQSSKFFLKVKPWWVGEANKDKVRCITTDTAMANFYTLEYNKESEDAVCLMNYVWEDYSEKAESLGELNDRYQRFLSDLKQLDDIDYILDAMPDKVDASNAVKIDWQLKQYYNGAFALSEATQEDYLSKLFYNFMDVSKDKAKIYFAGDSYSWVGGWVEGALQTGLNAFSAIATNMGGKLTANDYSPFENLNSESIRYDNPSWNDAVISFGPYGGSSVHTQPFNQPLSTNDSLVLHIQGNCICGVEVNQQLIGGKTGYKTVSINLAEPVEHLKLYVIDSDYYRATIVNCIEVNGEIYGGKPEEGALVYEMSFLSHMYFSNINGLTGDAVDRLGFSFSEPVLEKKSTSETANKVSNLSQLATYSFLLIMCFFSLLSCKEEKKEEAPIKETKKPTTEQSNENMGIKPQHFSIYKEESEFHFPEDSTKIYEWLANRDTLKITQHAWGIWENLTRKTNQTYNGDTLYVFETWMGVDELAKMSAAQDREGGCNQLKTERTDLEIPKQFFHAQLFANQAKIDSTFKVLETVSYNPSAACFATQNLIFNKSVLDGYYRKDKIGKIPDFPADAITTKPTYYAGKPNSDDLIRVPVWPGMPNPAKEFGNEDWNFYVFVDITNGQAKDKKLVPVKGNNPTDKEIAKATCNLNEFIHYKIDQEGAAYLNKHEDIDTKTSSQFKVGDYVLLVGMHVGTKEISNWTWQTYYWTYRPDNPTSPSSKFNAELRPSSITGAAANYAVSTAYAMVWPNQPITGGSDKGAEAIISFNPYLEGSFGPGVFQFKNTFKPSYKYGVQTNCMTCHALAIPPGGKYSTAQYISMDNEYFKNQVQLDFAWSIQGNLNKDK
ncbi:MULTISPECIES: NAD(P)/FAD-dependent oxidoreductase [Mesonia]|uniref:Tryptophan 2-monooxygenase n=1 Tax=Mesonia oceanica TaxID=2687242 RepID=A0AC61YAT0_9FLAO|nr:MULTISPECIES: NAD(P)/FAD-dependent oxidoreductase [Mesonia]MBJ96988.1 hypothetical protein [Flavobacteriaceae bacterium]MAN25934.1 hypothetical protein [Mesonia sp.]MAN26145.1 hypothetical protein [Mesonia sp.]MAQ39513.1 hypothetical protein [Mesonia sp.]VVV01601.1 Tryptophan 2-monooxygenase [Mesonia oceanica]|tara:strand:- start:10574 stop:14353 length:3780 start_codon:yes stop_codon:yes gene_type:complete